MKNDSELGTVPKEIVDRLKLLEEKKRARARELSQKGKYDLYSDSVYKIYQDEIDYLHKEGKAFLQHNIGK